MRVKQCLCVLLMCVMFSGCAFAEGDYVGFLSRLRTSPEEFFMLMRNSWATKGWAILGGDHTTSKAKFYDSMMMMQMALARGEIDEMILPDFAAEYMLKMNSNYAPCCVSNSGRMNLCFGFMKNKRELLQKWNSALISMRNDFTLSGFEQKYIKNFPEDTSYDYVYGITERQRRKKNTITFERFPNSPTVKVAVTGDLPPVDFVDDAGMPAGYSTAVLAEMGKRLRLNIDLVNINAGARTAALVSGRADVVFWYEVNKSLEKQPDVPDDIILSEPYLGWDTFMHITLKQD